MTIINTQTMKAIRFHDYGGPDVLKYEDVLRPMPQKGEVLIQVQAAGVNPFDLATREGWMRSYFPLLLAANAGVDVAGIVKATGEGVTAYTVGQDVYGFMGMGSGAYAEYTTVAIATIAPKPQTLDYVQAASIPLAATTAWQALFEIGGLQAGQKVLIHGGAGGVGTFAVQMAKLKGIYVIATASAQNIDFVKSLGADEVIDYSATPFEAIANDVDVVLDLIGGETQERSWGVLKAGGILISSLAPPSQVSAASYGVRAVLMGAQPTTSLLQEFTDLLDGGQLKTHVGKVFPLEQARQAQELKHHGHTRGKIVLQIAE